MVRVAVVSSVLVLLCAGLPLGAQQQVATVRVTVVARDSAGRVLSGADVSIVQGLHDVLSSATTNERGRVAMIIPAGKEDYQLVARKIGYTRSDRFFRADRDTLSFEIVLRRPVQELAAVKVTAEEDLKR